MKEVLNRFKPQAFYASSPSTKSYLSSNIKYTRTIDNSVLLFGIICMNIDLLLYRYFGMIQTEYTYTLKH